MKRFFKFILIGLFFGGVPEVVNQIYLKHSIEGFRQTVLSYFVFLVTLFFIRKIFNKAIKSPRVSAVAWYVLWGFIGLYIEWTFLGTKGVVWYGQIGMFTFWASMTLMPVIFTEGYASSALKKHILLYSLIWAIVFLVGGLAINSGFSLIVWMFGCLWLNVYMFSYIRGLKNAG